MNQEYTNTDEGSANDLLDTSISNLPTNAQLPSGAHRCLFTYESKKVNDNPTLILKFKLIETQELEDSTQEAPTPGTECDVMFNMVNEFGVKAAGKVTHSLAAQQGLPKTATIREVLDPINGSEVILVSKLPAGKDYIRIEDILIGG